MATLLEYIPWKLHLLPSYTVRTRSCDTLMEFEVFAVESTDMDGADRRYIVKGSVAGSTPNLEESEVYLSGGLKWDGCCNFKFDAQESCMLHTCRREDMEEIGKLLTAIWDLGASEIKDWY